MKLRKDCRVLHWFESYPEHSEAESKQIPFWNKRTSKPDTLRKWTAWPQSFVLPVTNWKCCKCSLKADELFLLGLNPQCFTLVLNCWSNISTDSFIGGKHVCTLILRQTRLVALPGNKTLCFLHFTSIILMNTAILFPLTQRLYIWSCLPLSYSRYIIFI